MRQFEVVIEKTTKNTYRVCANSIVEAKFLATALNSERNPDPDDSVTSVNVYCKHFGVSADK